MYKAFYTQGDDYMVSSPETSSGQAIWQIKTNYNHIKIIFQYKPDYLRNAVKSTI